MSLARLLAEETQLCPAPLLDPAVLASCQAWEAEKASNYDCSNDPHLQALTPGKHAGVEASYLSFNTAQSTGHFVDRAKLFEQCTGGVINFAEATDIAEDPITDIGSASSIGAELYDAYLMIYSFTSEASSLGLLENLNDRIKESNTLLRYEDLFPKVRSMGEYRKDGKTNVDLLMADGDFFVPIVRIDLLEKFDLPLPHTWEDLVETARFFNGTDLNDDGDTNDFGFCIYPRTGSGFNDAWIPELMYSTWATTDQTKGIQEGFLFDDETFEPRIGAGFENAMDVWKDLWPNSADGCITPTFVSGRCAIGLAPPGCWKGTFVNSKEGGVAWRNMETWEVLTDENGEALWRPTMKDGSYAEPYRMRPFGSLKVVNEDDRLVPCTPETCPKGERIQKSADLPADDRARILKDSPHAGQIINRVPFYWSGGYGTGIRKSANDTQKDLMWDFFVYVNSPTTSVDDVVIPSWLDAWRNSQLSDCDGVLAAGTWDDPNATQTCNFREGGWSEVTFREHKRTMDWALGNEVNSALTLRLPGVLGYTREVLLPKFLRYMDGKISMEDLKQSTIDGWNDVTASRGKLTQLEIYRASLSRDPLSQYDLCQLHREEMDKEDPSICAQYDPKEEESNDNAKLLVAVLVPVCVVVLAAILGVWMYHERKRRQADAIWKIDKNELKFDDPPEVAGRGTFGLVVKAEYRGTTVAVKRVIPPKERANRAASFLEEENPNAGTESGIATGVPQDPKNGKKTGVPRQSSMTGSMTSSMVSMDRIFEAKDSKGLDNVEEATPDLEAGPPVHRNIYSSVETGVTAVSSKNHSGSLEGASSRGASKAKWKRWFGYSSSTGGKNYEQLKQEFIVEMRVLSKLRHPCITTVMGCVIDSKEEPMLVMEFMAYGSLYDLLHNQSLSIDGELISPILQDVARGARFLHAADPKIIHGDLKAANVLVDGRFRAKISDFGLSAKKKYLGACGTPYWMAPELLRRESTNTPESDVYSFGIILYELYSRQDPYEGENPATVLDEICDKKINKRPPVPEHCPAKIAEIMNECVDGNPEKRPTFEEIDLRIQRLDSENVDPGEINLGHSRRRASNEEDLINQVFPKHVAKALLQGRKVEPDRVEMATMFFSDIVGFTSISSKMTPEEVSDLLDRLYLKFDALSEKHDVFKIETIGDAYVGVCNLVKNQEGDHAKRIAEFAIDTVKAAGETFILPDDPSMGTVKIRIGVHCGPLVARVVGSRNPRYCVFGDTVNTTARMESNSLSMRIQCSDRAAEVLKKQAPELPLESRGVIHIKGKGEMSTFFLSK